MTPADSGARVTMVDPADVRVDEAASESGPVGRVGRRVASHRSRTARSRRSRPRHDLDRARPRRPGRLGASPPRARRPPRPCRRVPAPSCARPICPISASRPTAGFSSCDRATSRATSRKNPPITPVTANIVQSDRPSQGAASGTLNSSSEPRTNAISPPTVSTPCVGANTSTTNSRKREPHQSQAGVVHWQRPERVEPEQQADPAHHARQDAARVRQLEEEAHRAEAEQDVGDRRVADGVQELVDEAHLDSLDLCIGRLERHRPAGRRDGPAVDLAQQVVQVGRDEVDDAETQRLLRRHVDALADRLFGPVGVPAALLGQRRM